MSLAAITSASYEATGDCGQIRSIFTLVCDLSFAARSSVRTAARWSCANLMACSGCPIWRQWRCAITGIQTQTERKRQEETARCAEHHHHRAVMARLCGPINPHSGTLTIATELGSTKLLIMRKDQATLAPSGRPHGECRLKNDRRRT